MENNNEKVVEGKKKYLDILNDLSFETIKIKLNNKEYNLNEKKREIGNDNK